MQAVTITQISAPELENLIESSLRKILSSTPQNSNTQLPTDELLTVKDAAEYLRLSVPTIYGLIHKGELPVMKRSKRCYFSKIELTNYIKQGRKKTVSEIEAGADIYLATKKAR